MISTLSSPSTIRKPKPTKSTTALSSTTVDNTATPSTPSTTTKAIDGARWKNEFNTGILAYKNDSLNNPLFTTDRYNETVELINSAKLKRYSDRNEQEISLLKTYDVINSGIHQKLVKKINLSEAGTVKYYVLFDELFDIIQTVHTTIGHRGINNTVKEIKKIYANVTEKQVVLFISGCYECKIKKSKPKNSSKLVVQPVISNDFNARGQVDLIDMQSCPDGPFKFILNYQDHFTKFCILRSLKTKTAAEVAYHLLDIFTTFGAPAILQSDNGREFVAKVINELAEMWTGLRIVHGRPRHPQSQGSVERSNQDTKQLLEAKIGLASTSLHPSIFDSITTEEELQNKLGLQAVDTNTIDEVEYNHGVEELFENGHEEIICNEQDDQHLDNDNEHAISSFDDRFERLNINRRSAREGQKHQAAEFLQNTLKKQKLTNMGIGDNVLISMPDVDRGPTDACNILGVIMEIKYDKYKLGTQNGVLQGYYSYHQISKAPGVPTLLIQDIEDEPKTLREIARLQSITGGQGMLKCNCKGGCKTNKCKCKQANLMCNSRCHYSATCCNK
ncbi:unnamed protein product [Rotaria sp. Silwood2]|nr:unnamed protein product [Rotaria sp. Silwood2]CAF3208792.1 unnamed protein product [Rotaria sp. Silwood2]CAF4425051.1 unnamed protein product [Rotaria sp. Silwood2]CAF4599178.1 unnamed protein product [Rotaria sp. Silwood2]